MTTIKSTLTILYSLIQSSSLIWVLSFLSSLDDAQADTAVDVCVRSNSNFVFPFSFPFFPSIFQPRRVQLWYGCSLTVHSAQHCAGANSAARVEQPLAPRRPSRETIEKGDTRIWLSLSVYEYVCVCVQRGK